MAHMAGNIKINALNLLLLFPAARQRQRPALIARRRSSRRHIRPRDTVAVRGKLPAMDPVAPCRTTGRLPRAGVTLRPVR